MRHILIIFVFMLAFMEAKAQNVYGNYEIKFIIAQNGNVKPSRGEIRIQQGELVYLKGSVTKNWEIIDKGDVYHNEKDNIKFKFRAFYLVNKNIYIHVSYEKIIKHDGVRYYALIMDGETQLAL